MSEPVAKENRRFRVLDIKTPLFWFVVLLRHDRGGLLLESRFWRGRVLPERMRAAWWIHGFNRETTPLDGDFEKRVETFDQMARAFRDSILRAEVFDAPAAKQAADLFSLTMMAIYENDSALLQRSVRALEEIVDCDDADDWPDEISA